MRRRIRLAILRFIRANALCFACLVLLAAGCDNPAKVASREVDRISRSILTAQSQLQKVTDAGIQRAALEAGTAMGLRLRALGCPSGSSSQPASAPAECHAAAAEYLGAYQAQAAQIAGAAAKADESLKAAQKALLPVVDILVTLELVKDDGSLMSKLLPLVSEALRLFNDGWAAYQACKQLAGGGQ